jgi:hypothetical protein
LVLAAHFYEVGDHQVAVAQPQVVCVGELLDPSDLIRCAVEQFVELEEPEVDHARGEPERLDLLKCPFLTDDRQLRYVRNTIFRKRIPKQPNQMVNQVPSPEVKWAVLETCSKGSTGIW